MFSKTDKKFLVALIIIILFLFPVKARGKIQLWKDEASTCFQCHQDMEAKLSDRYVHFPFKEGKCTACHDVHASRYEGLLRNEVNLLCLRCHKGLKKDMRDMKVHGALREGICTDCHTPHSSNNVYILLKPERELCFKCHKALKAEKVYKHAPFNRGECSSCHTAHVSLEENLLKAEPNSICKKCHKPGCKMKEVSIVRYTKDMNCTGCHTGHNTDNQGLLGPYGHPDFLKRNCEACHQVKAKEGKVLTKQEGSSLCYNCHRKLPSLFHEEDIHGTFQDNPCSMCHNHHASNKKNLTVNEKALCISCHGDVDQSINYMTRRLKGIRCVPVKNRECFKCHAPFHTDRPYYFKEDSNIIPTCATCHEREHKVAHPMGEGVTDPRDGSTVTCESCHSMHAARAEFMLQFDRSRELCIQCHKMY
jgi:predicted CXXCH cytochrome family protein